MKIRLNDLFANGILPVIAVIFLLSYTTVNIQSGAVVDDSDREILITLENASFAPLTTVSGNQVLVSVTYQVNDDSLKGEKVNGMMEIYYSNGTLMKSSSYPDGFTAKKNGGTKDFKTTISDPTIDSVIANLTFTNLKKTKELSNTITTELTLEKINAGLSNYTAN